MRLLLLLILVATLALTAQVTQAASDRFVQEQFAIGFWNGPPDKLTNEAVYKEMAEANFNLVIANYWPTAPEYTKKQLAMCEKYGLAAVVSVDWTKPEKLVDAPNCWGYYICDEPGAGGIPAVKSQVDIARKYRPGKLAYYNLLPDYAPAWALGVPTYDEYVGRFAKETACDVLCMDYYPMLTPFDDGRDGYCGNLAVMRKHALLNKIPFWNFFNTMPFANFYDPTESQLRWQIYTSIAYGAKGILYFCYWTPHGGEFPKGGAIITAEGQRTRHYEQAKRINAAVKNLGPTLMKLVSYKVIRIKPNDDPAAILEKSPVKSISPGGNYLIGVFKHRDGRRAVLLNNYDHNYTTWPTVEFDAPDKDIVEVDQSDGKEKMARDDSPDMPGLQISLDSGEGRLFLLPAK